MTAAPLAAPSGIDRPSFFAGFTVRRSGAEVTVRCEGCRQPVMRDRAITVLDVMLRAGMHSARCPGRRDD